MNALLLLASPPSSTSAAAPRDPQGVDAGGVTFVSLLTLAAAGEPAAAMPETVELSPAAPGTADPSLPGIALPPPLAGTGKFLPQDLPLALVRTKDAGTDADADAGNEAEGATDSGSGPVDGCASVLGSTPPALPAPVLIAPALVAPPAEPAPAQPQLPPTSHAVPAPQPALLLEKSSGLPGDAEAAHLTAPPAPPSPLSDPKPQPAVLVTMDAAPEKTPRPGRSQPLPQGGDHRAPELARATSPLSSAPVPPPVPAADSPARTASGGPSNPASSEKAPAFAVAERLSPDSATPADPRQGSFVSLQPPSVRAPEPAAIAPQPAAMQELSAIVDRLAAAREAFAPATVAMALDHAELGEMTLRFEQKQDGQLTVGLSGGTAEAHRAIAAALATERAPAGGERPATDSQQQPSSQARSGSGSGGNIDRGAASDTGGRGGHSPGQGQQRQDSPQNQQARPGWRSTARSEPSRGGVYA